MATLQYLVRATDDASATFTRIAASADRLNEDLNKLDGKTATATAKLEDKQMKFDLDDIELKMARLDKRVTTSHMNDDQIARARHEAERLSLALDKLNAKRTKIHVDSSALTKLGKASFLQPSLIGTAVALSPALIPLAAQVAAGVGAIGISFGAAGAAAGIFGVMAGTVLAKASQDAQKLAALNVKLATASTAAQKKAVKQQIDALTAGWAKGYMDLIGNYQDFQAKWKSISQAVTVPTLNVWLPVLTKGLQFLKPLIKPVADAFTLWGITLNTYFSDPVHAKRISELAAAFGNFAAQQLFHIGQFILDIGKGIFNLGKDLAANGANFSAAGTWLAGIGDGFLAWSKSKKARDDVHGFMKFLHDEGPVVKGILKDLGKILPGIFAGATTVGTLELQALGDFLSLVAKLPKGWQAPLTEAAGALLLLSKTGVIKVGLKLVGLGAKLLSGGTIALAGDAAAAEMKAAIVSGGAQAAGEIRAAMTGGAAAAVGGAEGAAAGAAAGSGSKFKLLGIGWGALLAAGLVVGVTAKLPVIHRSIWSLGDPPGPGQKANFLNSWSAFGQGLARSFSDSFVKPSETAFHAVSASFTVFRHDMSASFDAFRHTMSASFAALRHDIAAAWSAIWSNTRNAVSTGITAVVRFFSGLPARALGALRGLGHSLYAFGHAALGEFLSGLKSVGSSILGWLGTFVGKIIGAIGKLLRLHSPSGVFFDIGKNMMLGLANGIKAHAHTAANAAQGAVGALGGPTTASARQAQAYARSRLGAYGWGAAQMPPLIALWMGESGWSRLARNQSSGAYGIPQALPPGKMGAAANPPTSSAAAQINWGLGYIRSVYGSPGAAYSRWLSRSPHWYDRGGWLQPGVTMAVNATGQPEQVIPNSGPGSMAEVTALLRQLIAATQAAPARSGVAFARELNGSATRALR